jgi:hypothetical protein
MKEQSIKIYNVGKRNMICRWGDCILKCGYIPHNTKVMTVTHYQGSFVVCEKCIPKFFLELERRLKEENMYNDIILKAVLD